MITLYKNAWHHFSSNIAFILIIIVALEFSDFAVAYWDLSSSSLLVARLIIIMYLHQIVLFDRRLPLYGKSTGDQPPFGHFIWASIIILIGALVLAGCGFWLSGYDGHQIIELFTILTLIAYFLLLVLFGTSLPAAVARDRYNPKISLTRVPKTWVGIFGGLLVGPALFGLVIIVLMYILFINFGLDINDYSQLSEFTVPKLLYGLCNHASNVFASMLGVVVLCRAYIRVAPPEILTVITKARQISD